MLLPSLLYHGSAYRQSELMPGFLRSHEEVFWDQGESNAFLYTTTEREAAIALGFASALEKRFPIDRFVNDGKTITCYIGDKHINALRVSLTQLEVYLYTIVPTQSQKWIKNTNPNNNLTTEYKTQQTIQTLKAVERVDLRQWLRTQSFQVLATKPNWTKW